MPQLSDIEHLKETLKSFGNEVDTLQSWGEKLQNTTAPVRKVAPPDFTKSGASVDASTQKGSPTEEAPSANNSEVKDDFSDFLNNLDLTPGGSNQEKKDDNFLGSEAFDNNLPDLDSFDSNNNDYDALSNPDDFLKSLDTEINQNTNTQEQKVQDLNSLDDTKNQENNVQDSIPEEDLQDLSSSDLDELSDIEDNNAGNSPNDVDTFDNNSVPEDLLTEELPEEISNDSKAPSQSSDSEDFSVPDDLLSGLSDSLESTEDISPDTEDAYDGVPRGESSFSDENSISLGEEALDSDSFIPDSSDITDTEEISPAPTVPDIDFGDEMNLGGEEVEDLGGEEVEDLGGEEVEDLGGEEVEDLGGEEVEDLGGEEVEDLGGEEVEDLGGEEVEDLGGEEVEDLGGEEVDNFDSGLDEVEDIGDDFSSDTNFNENDAASEVPNIPDLDPSAFEESQMSEIDKQLAAIEGDPEPIDNFMFDSDWGGGEFSIPGFEMGNEIGKETLQTKKAPLKTAEYGSTEKAKKKIKAINLSVKQVDKLQDTLLSYPLNLRLAVEDIIANKTGSEELQFELIWMLVEGAKATESAKVAGKILKRYIEIPAGFSKKTGAALEEEKGTLKYMFIHSILPVLQVILLVALATGILFGLGYNFAYRPIKADSLYSEGYKLIDSKRYDESDEVFERAKTYWILKKWHYRYAESYRDKKQTDRAAKKYWNIMQMWPKDIKAPLDYARMESEIVMDYSRAEELVRDYVLQIDYKNMDGLLLYIDNYSRWLESELYRYDDTDMSVVEELLEKQRFQIASTIQLQGRTEETLERMLKYLIDAETILGQDKLSEIKPLMEYFLGTKKCRWSCMTIAELGQYMLDRNEQESIRDLLMRGIEIDEYLPEIHVAMAKWNRASGFKDEEQRALDFANRFYGEILEKESFLSNKRTRKYIESLMDSSELKQLSGNILDAEESINTAIDIYEKAIKERRIKPNKKYGRAYSILADIYYKDQLDFDSALIFYEKAENDGYTSTKTDYHRGYINYMFPKDDGSKALQYFYRAGTDEAQSPYLTLATANALYERADYFAAQGYYKMLAARMQFELSQISRPVPQERASHGEIVELLMQTRNNLGAALYQLAERTGDTTQRASAMVEFTESSRLFDSLVRDQETMIRPEDKNLSYLNLDYVFHPMRGTNISIYKTIPPEMTYPQ